MTTQPPEADLRAQVKAALATARISQAEAARRLDLSTKHMSRMLTGRATLTLDWADRILTLCGMTLAIAAIPATSQAPSNQLERIPLDDLTSDALDALYDRAERLHRFRNRWAAHAGRLQDRALTVEARVRALEADLHRYEEVVVGDLNEANIGLQREVSRLTAGQCTHALAVCETHHAVPVAGCPYPRCRAAAATGRAATA